MKLAFASAVTGIVITVAIFITVLFLRVLLRDNASVIFALWFFGWPILVMPCIGGISETGRIWLSLAIGMLLDTVFISLAVYGLLRLIVSRRKRARVALPPQAPTF
jgi:hypothetical protein